MQEKIKSIIALYLKKEASEINNATLIDRTALKNSILVHRLYGSLANEGIIVQNYMNIKTVGDLLEKLTLAPLEKPAQNLPQEKDENHNNGSLGIDMEMVENMPYCDDFRENAFYNQNFSDREISYCILQSEPRVSFAGLFAAKEALVKADNTLKGISFNQLVIEHDSNGKPYFNNAELSVSHNGTYAIAVVKKNAGMESAALDQLQSDLNKLSMQLKIIQRKFSYWKLFSFALLLLLVFVIVYIFYK